MEIAFHLGFYPVIARGCVFVKECQVDSKQLAHAVVMFLTQSSKIWLDNCNRLPGYASCVRHFLLSLILYWVEVRLLGEKCVCACLYVWLLEVVKWSDR